MKSIFKTIISAVIQFEAVLVLKRYKPKVVGITGSVGKTSAKDSVYAVLSTTYHTRKSEKSFNSDIGIPLTILGCKNAWYNPFKWLGVILKGLGLIFFKNNYPEWLVLEVGADRPGDIKKVSKWLKPDVVVLTAFAKVPVHVEFFNGRDDIVREKKYLVDALKHDGVLIVNGDDEDSMKIKEGVKNISIIYGTDKVSDLVATETKIFYDDGKISGTTFKVEYGENIVPVFIKGTLGAKSLYSSLSAIAVGISQKINIVKAAEALGNLEPSRGRMRILDGIKETIIIDDTYNSSPVALSSALHTLESIETKGRGKKIAVLGDMLELGKHSSEEHYKAGKLVSEVCGIFLTVGIRSRKMVEGALDGLMAEKKIYQFDNSIDAGKFLQTIIKENDIILVKGSQSMRMEKVIEEIMLDPLNANNLLVRQEEEWKNK